ncbi:MAG TPA: hypothetical protein VF614_05330 [Chthoniobacteraceae bacterium]|jgi:hypothetical protein
MKPVSFSFLSLLAAGGLLISLSTGCSTSSAGARSGIPKTPGSEIPITIAKVTPSMSAKGRRSTPRAKSIPVGNDQTFTLSVDSWPAGTTSASIKVQVYQATITTSGLSYPTGSPLQVFPGTSNAYKFVSTSSTTPGSVTINIPSTIGGVSMTGKNFLLLGSRDLTTTSGTVTVGGGAIFSTAP